MAGRSYLSEAMLMASRHFNFLSCAPTVRHDGARKKRVAMWMACIRATTVVEFTWASAPAPQRSPTNLGELAEDTMTFAIFP